LSQLRFRFVFPDSQNAQFPVPLPEDLPTEEPIKKLIAAQERKARTLRTPLVEYCFVKSEVEAQKLKSHLEKNLRSYHYRAIDEDNRPMLDKAGDPIICREPRIDVVIFS
jgi:hypothetical protein